MKFKQEVPQYYCIKDVPNFSLFLEHGQPEMCSFLVNFFGLDEVKVQCVNCTPCQGHFKF